MASTTSKAPRYWIGVYELRDVVPRRDPKKPNLYVAKSTSRPTDRFAAIARSRKQHWYTGHLVKPRPDLGPSKSFGSQDEATEICSKLIKKLKKEGYTVNRDTRVWTVYVVELDRAGTTDPGRGFLYVGETSLTPEARFAQHRSGARNMRGRLYSPVVKKYGKKLRPDLAPKSCYFDSASAKRAEREHFELLQSKGYTVKGGH